MEKTNFKKWGWWAIGGVVAIVIIAGVVAMMGSGPEPTSSNEPGDNNGNTEVVSGDPEKTEKPKEDVAVAEPDTLPQSGPVEEGIAGILLAGVFAYIAGLSLTSIYRAAKREK